MNMGDMMWFPETVDEFMEDHKMVDTEQIYSNGTEFVPIFRMKQWFEHEAAKKQEKGWISVKDDMPKEHDSIFARFYGTDKWRTGMFRTASDDVIACVEYEDGSRLVKVLHTITGEWHMSGIPGGGIVTHWMPQPEPPKEG